MAVAFQKAAAGVVIGCTVIGAFLGCVLGVLSGHLLGLMLAGLACALTGFLLSLVPAFILEVCAWGFRRYSERLKRTLQSWERL